MRAAVERTAEELRAAGHTVTEVKIPYPLGSKALTVRYLAGIRDGADGTDDPGRLEKRTKAIARLGRPFGARSVEWAKRKGRAWGDQVHDDLGVDVLLTPVMSGPAIEVEHWRGKGGAGDGAVDECVLSLHGAVEPRRACRRSRCRPAHRRTGCRWRCSSSPAAATTPG